MTPSRWRREGREDYDGGHAYDSFKLRFSITKFDWRSNLNNYKDGWAEAEATAEEENKAEAEHQESPLGVLQEKIYVYDNADGKLHSILTKMYDILESLSGF